MGEYLEDWKEKTKLQYDIIIENFKYNFDRQDKFLVWIAGFDIVGISLLISTNKLPPSFTHCYIKLIIALLGISLLATIYNTPHFRYQKA